MKKPFSYVYSGDYWWVDGTLWSGNTGKAWTSEAHSSTNVYYLHFGSGDDVWPQNSNVKSYGFSVRCVSK